MCTAICCVSLLAARQAQAACDGGARAEPSARYDIRGATVLDSDTGLVWQRCSVGQEWREGRGCIGVIRQMAWDEALQHASDGWRLPTHDELLSLVVAGCRDPAIDETLFPDMELPKLWYWTSTAEGAAVWFVAFGGGTARIANRTDLNSVRLVRPAD